MGQAAHTISAAELSARSAEVSRTACSVHTLAHQRLYRRAHNNTTNSACQTLVAYLQGDVHVEQHRLSSQ
jgi:hypothetical protein